MAKRRTAQPHIEGLESRWLLHAGPHTAAEVAPSSAHVPKTRLYPIRLLANQPYQAAAGRRLLMDVVLPGGPKPSGGRPAVLAFPGGGWREADRSFLLGQVAQLAQRGYVVAAVDVAYASKQLGTRVWPTNFEDARQAVRWVRSHAARYGVNPDQIAVLGQSAGGQIAALLGTYPDAPIAANGRPKPGSSRAPAVSSRVQAVVNMYGPNDLVALARRGGSVLPYLSTFLGGSVDQVLERYETASPIRHVSSDDPPFLLFNGTADPTVPPGQATEMAAALRRAGVPVRTVILNGVGHGFYLQGQGPKSTLQATLDFLDKVFHDQGQGI